jgi:hypothetical protein
MNIYCWSSTHLLNSSCFLYVLSCASGELQHRFILPESPKRRAHQQLKDHRLLVILELSVVHFRVERIGGYTSDHSPLCTGLGVLAGLTLPRKSGRERPGRPQKNDRHCFDELQKGRASDGILSSRTDQVQDDKVRLPIPTNLENSGSLKTCKKKIR